MPTGSILAIALAIGIPTASRNMGAGIATSIAIFVIMKYFQQRTGRQHSK